MATMPPDKSDLFNWAERRRDIGMERAVEHADAVQDSWSVDATAALLAYAHRIGRSFLVEEVREAATWLPSPPDGRAWGAVTRRAALAGSIVRVGYAPAASSNCSPKCLWSVPDDR
jgi:hypothetical protein